MNVTEAEALECVGEGWAPLIRRLYAAKPEDITVLQVKEKFGGLRFYVSPWDAGYGRLISEAESESFTLCETCGAQGLDQSRYWALTLCDEHRRERAARRG